MTQEDYTKMTFEKFIKKYVRVASEGKHIEMISAQYVFLYWIEKCKQKGLKLFYLKGKGRI